MKILSAAHSSFPRIGEESKDQRLRRAYADLEKNKITDVQFHQIENELVDEIISIQKEANLDIITDGLIRWYDPVSHLARNLSGFEINGLLRFFDTNFYFRQPIAGKNISGGQGHLADEIDYASKICDKPLKAVVLGPYSFARMSLNSSGMPFEQFALRISEILNGELKKISRAGAKYIQIDEPFFVREPQEIDLFKDCLTKCCTGISDTATILTFYFGDCAKIYNQVGDLQVDVLGFDFSYSPSLLEKLVIDGFNKPIAFGVIDGRNTRLESAEAIAKIMEKPIKKIGFDNCQITSSCGLEFLPRQYAIKKLSVISRVAKLLNG
jgi:5-methyltetrahydropteroyltriglutamate--homocysteine methyltransferase